MDGWVSDSDFWGLCWLCPIGMCDSMLYIYIYIDREYRYDDTYLIYIYIYIIYIGELH